LTGGPADVLQLEGCAIIPVDMGCDNHQHGHSHPFTPVANLRQPMPLWRKLALVVSNNLIKIRNRQRCCGNLGQPGC